MTLDPAPLKLEKAGDGHCGGKLDSFKAQRLEPGEYTLEIVVERTDTGNMITKATAPLLVH